MRPAIHQLSVSREGHSYSRPTWAISAPFNPNVSSPQTAALWSRIKVLTTIRSTGQGIRMITKANNAEYFGT